jgi:hypothetical protein
MSYGCAHTSPKSRRKNANANAAITIDPAMQRLVKELRAPGCSKTTVYLSNTKIDVEAASALASALKVNTSVKSLDLRFNL